MTGIAEFLTARYDEAQRLAEAAADAARFGGDVDGTHWSNPGGGDVFCAGLPVAVLGPWDSSAAKKELGAFIAANDPARVLADIAAKRKRLEMYIEAKRLLEGVLKGTRPAALAEETPADFHTHVLERRKVQCLWWSRLDPPWRSATDPYGRLEFDPGVGLFRTHRVS